VRLTCTLLLRGQLARRQQRPERTCPLLRPSRRSARTTPITPTPTPIAVIMDRRTRRSSLHGSIDASRCLGTLPLGVALSCNSSLYALPPKPTLEHNQTASHRTSRAEVNRTCDLCGRNRTISTHSASHHLHTFSASRRAKAPTRAVAVTVPQDVRYHCLAAYGRIIVNFLSARSLLLPLPLLLLPKLREAGSCALAQFKRRAGLRHDTGMHDDDAIAMHDRI